MKPTLNSFWDDKVYFVRLFYVVLLATFLSACGDKVEVLHGLSEREANLSIAKLTEFGISANKKIEAKGTWQVQVPAEVANYSISLLTRGQAMELVKDSEVKFSLLSSSHERRFQITRILAGEIEKTLLSLPNVNQAKVHLNLAESDSLLSRVKSASKQDDHNFGTASVLMVVQKDSKLNKSEVARLVSGASGISSKKIAVWIQEGKDFDLKNALNTSNKPDSNYRGKLIWKSDNLIILLTATALTLTLIVSIKLSKTRAISIPKYIPSASNNHLENNQSSNIK